VSVKRLSPVLLEAYRRVALASRFHGSRMTFPALSVYGNQEIKEAIDLAVEAVGALVERMKSGREMGGLDRKVA